MKEFFFQYTLNEIQIYSNINFSADLPGDTEGAEPGEEGGARRGPGNIVVK